MGKGAKGNQGAKAQAKGKAPAEDNNNRWGATGGGGGDGDNDDNDGDNWGGFGTLGDWDVPDEKPVRAAPHAAPPPGNKNNPWIGKQQQNGPPPTVTLTSAPGGGFTFQPGASAYHATAMAAGPAMDPNGTGNGFPSAFTNGARFGTTGTYPANNPAPAAAKNAYNAYPTSPQNGPVRARFADQQPPAVIALGLPPPWPPNPNQPAQGGADTGHDGKQKGNTKKQKGNPNQNNNNQNQAKKQKQAQRQDNGWEDHAGDAWDNSTTMYNDNSDAKTHWDAPGPTWEEPLPGGGADDWGNDPYSANANANPYPRHGGGQQDTQGGKKGKQKGKKNQNNDYHNDSTWQQYGDTNYEKNNDGWGVQGSNWEEHDTGGFLDEKPLPTASWRGGDTRGYGSPMLATLADRKDAATVKIEESGGKGLEAAQHALYGTHRVAEARFMWILPYQHDPRVTWMIDFIQQSSASLATLGFHKYLKSREKGALMVNAGYISDKRPDEPAFDWVAFSEIQKTRDRTIQQQIAANNPAKTCLVFVFLVSKSGNSLGIWRRKLQVPQSLQSTYQAQVRSVEADLRDKVYIVKVDPPIVAGTATDPAMARKWSAPAKPQKSSKLSKLVGWISWGSSGNKIKKKPKQDSLPRL